MRLILLFNYFCSVDQGRVYTLCPFLRRNSCLLVRYFEWKPVCCKYNWHCF